MSSFSEKTRVQIPAILHLNRLGYTFLQKKDVTWDKKTNVLTDIFYDSLKRINKNYTKAEFECFYDELQIITGNDDLGEAFFKILQRREGIRLIDFFNIDNNDFSCTYEMPFESDGSDFRPDVTIYVNGIPLAFIEVKVPNNKDGIEKERKRMNDRLENKAFRRFFNEFQLLIFSNNMEYEDNQDSIVPISGSFYSTVQRNNFRFSPFREEDLSLIEKYAIKDFDQDTEKSVLCEANAQSAKWTPEYQTNLDGRRPTNRILTSLLSKERFLFLLNYGFCYVREKNEETGITEVTKHVMRYPQLLGSLSLISKLDQGLRKGIFWHSQGSGKTELSYYLVKILTDYFYREKELNTRFLFIPDRIDLLDQARDEFNNRGLSAKTVSNRDQFVKTIQKPGIKSGNDGNYEIMVLNTQKISEEAQITSSTHYTTNNQTIIIVDECHRSYDIYGSFLPNLLNIDKNAIIIGLTGTPLILGKDEEKSKALFGNYIHKYFYNQSIADGCTLRLMREPVLKTFYDKLQTIKTGLIQQGTIDLNDIYCYPRYVDEIVNYITNDFETFQKIHDFDSPNKTTGAMIVCYSNKQAKMVYDALKGQGKKVELVIYTTPKTDVVNIVDRFKKTNEIDYLVVELMLLTGFDCHRLKKLYLLRKLHEHNLLQGLTRVNRPFKDFKYGYIVDFENIMSEFQKTNEAYMRELNLLYGDDVTKDIQIFVDGAEIQQRTKEIDEKLFSFATNNMEEFTNQINQIKSYDELGELKKLLDEAKDLYNSARLSDNGKFYKLDINKILLMSKEVDRRYDIVRLQESLKNDNGENRALLIDALSNIDFKFIQGKEHELVLADKWRETVSNLTHQFEKNNDKDDPEYILLYEELRKILSEHDIEEINEEVLEKLESLTDQIFNLNAKDLRLAKKYNDDFKFVRLHKRFKELFKTMSELELHGILLEIKEYLDDMVSKNEHLLKNEPYMERAIQKEVYADFKKSDIKLSQDELGIIDRMIFTEYHNEYIGASI